MARLRLSLLVSFCLCASGLAAFAQTSQTPAASSDLPAVAAPKAPAKQSVHKKAASSQPKSQATNLQSAEEAEKAARLAEGRKKFFEQSSGFENNGSDLPLSLSNGGTPTMGFHF